MEIMFRFDLGSFFFLDRYRVLIDDFESFRKDVSDINTFPFLSL